LQETLDLEKAQTMQAKTATYELKTKLEMAVSEKKEISENNFLSGNKSFVRFIIFLHM
jgi:hypothetical protein